MNPTVDINCDLGEGVGNEAQLMPYLSSCNIACGGHAGDEATMTEVISLAIRNNTRIGAHPSFPDRVNFGRIEMNLSESELIESVRDQVDLLTSFTNKLGGKLHHVKPHGALYNMASVNSEIADAILAAISHLPADVVLYAPYNSVIANQALQKSISVKFEAFADRNYNDDLTLVSRKLSNATLHDPEEIFEHVFRMIKEREVTTISGSHKKIIANTLCVHGDNPNALEIITSLSQQLKANNIQIEKA